MKKNIKSIYKYMLENAKYYTVQTKEKTYFNVISLNYACLDGFSSFVYLRPLDNIEVSIIVGSTKNSDIKQIQEQENFIYL